MTGCSVNLYTRNIAHLLSLPIFKKKSKELSSVRNIMSHFRIQSNVNKLVGLNVFHLVHLFYTSLTFKNPQLLGIFISRVIKKNIKSFRFLFFFLSRILLPIFTFSGLKGLKIQFKGRLGSSLRKRTSIINFGSMPLQTINCEIKYSFTESITIYGICGIKIWYHY